MNTDETLNNLHKDTNDGNFTYRNSNNMEALPSGNDPQMLGQIKGWNWGAALLSWMWLLPISILWGIGLLILENLSAGIVGLISFIYFGLHGNEFAWKYRKFNSLEEFWAVQKAWTNTAVAILGTVLIGTLIIVICLMIFKPQ